MTNDGRALGALWLLALAGAMAGCGGGPPPVPPARDAGIDAQQRDGDVPDEDAGEADGDVPDEDGGPLPDGSMIDASRMDAGPHEETCPGYVEPPMGEDCRADGDCGEPSLFCSLPFGGARCRPCTAAPQECELDENCEEGSVCETFNASCPCRITLCVPACATTEDCTTGSTCDGAGHCVPQRCDAGFACPSIATCDPSSGRADAHGCVTAPCVEDVDCACGICVNGGCAEGPGTCTML